LIPENTGKKIYAVKMSYIGRIKGGLLPLPYNAIQSMPVEYAMLNCFNATLPGLARKLLYLIIALQINFVSAQKLPVKYISTETFGPDEGLRQSMVSQVYQDENELMWLVTVDGLHYFDGHEFSCFRLSPDGIINHSDNIMRSVTGFGENALCIASSSSIMLFNRETAGFTSVYRNEGSYPRLLDANLKKSPLAWITGAGLCSILSDTIVPVKLSFGHPFPVTFNPHKAFYTQGNILMYDSAGIIEFQAFLVPGSDTYRAAYYPVKGLQAMATDSKGTVFILSQGVLSVYSGKGKIKHLFNTGLLTPQFMIIDHSGKVWLCGQSDENMHIWENGRLSSFLFCVRDGQHNDTLTTRIHSIYEDNAHNIWFCTDNSGVFRYSPVQHSFNKAYTGFTRCIKALGSSIYAGTYKNGLWQLNEDLSSQRQLLSGVFNGQYLLDLTSDSRNRLWIVSRTSISAISPDGRLIFSYASPCQTARFVASVGDSILVIHNNTLSVFKTGINPRHIADFPFVQTNALLKIGKYTWYGNNFGLFRSQKDIFSGVAAITGEQNRISYAQIFGLISSGGYIWAATGNGILIFNQSGKQVSLSSDLQELANEVIYSLIDDKKGRIWFSGNNGIGFVNTRTGSVGIFGNSANMQSREFNANAAVRSSSGKIYFGGIKGINGFDPQNFEGGKNPMKVRLLKLFTADTLYCRGIPQNTPEVRLSRKAPHLSGSVYCTDYAQNNRVRFSYLLEGYQDTWTRPVTTNTFTYRNLPSGNYRLFVRSVDELGNTGPRTLLLTATLLPPFWKTNWFLILVISCIALGTALIVKKINSSRYNRRIRDLEYANTIEKERLRISRDMHDEVGASLTRISILSALATRQTADAEQKQKIIGQISEISGNVVDELSSIIWAINPKNDHTDSFIAYIRRYASTLLDEAGIHAVFSLPGQIDNRPMTAEWRRNLYLIVKEALNNCVKHAKATQVNLSITIENSMLTISISDNGSGFNTETTHSGNGLINMQRRAADAGGQVHIVSSPGNGTLVEASIQISAINSTKG